MLKSEKADSNLDYPVLVSLTQDFTVYYLLSPSFTLEEVVKVSFCDVRDIVVNQILKIIESSQLTLISKAAQRILHLVGID